MARLAITCIVLMLVCVNVGFTQVKAVRVSVDSNGVQSDKQS